jgi:hypothetical protein
MNLIILILRTKVHLFKIQKSFPADHSPLLRHIDISLTQLAYECGYYESVLSVPLHVVDCEIETMACFPEIDGQCPGAISWAKDFCSSKDGVLIHSGGKHGNCHDKH